MLTLTLVMTQADYFADNAAQAASDAGGISPPPPPPPAPGSQSQLLTMLSGLVAAITSGKLGEALGTQVCTTGVAELHGGGGQRGGRGVGEGGWGRVFGAWGADRHEVASALLGSGEAPSGAGTMERLGSRRGAGSFGCRGNRGVVQGGYLKGGDF